MKINDIINKSFDLHVHTVCSDGEYTPTQIIDKAKHAGLKTIAITDHDTLAGVAEATSAGKKLDIKVIAGVELSCKYQTKSVDVLGYDVKNIDLLNTKLQEFRDNRQLRAEKIIEKCNELGFAIKYEDVYRYATGEVIARPHIAQVFLEKNYVNSIQEAFDKYLADGMPCCVDKLFMTPEQAIAMIHEHGGLAVLAHPALLEDDSVVNDLLELNFDGIEVWHRKHNRQQAEHYFNLAKKKQLIATGGSDYHNDEHTLGEFGYFEEV